MARAIGQALDGRIAAKAEIGKSGGRDRPAAGRLAQFHERAGVPVMDRFFDRASLQLAGQHLQHDLPELLSGARASSLHGFPVRRPRNAACVARQLETGKLADHRVATDADLNGDLATGEAGLKSTLEQVETLGGPSRL